MNESPNCSTSSSACRFCFHRLGWPGRALTSLQGGIVGWLTIAFCTVAPMGNLARADKAGGVPDSDPYKLRVSESVALGLSLNGKQLVFGFSEPIAVLDGVQENSVSIVTPLGYSLTNLVVDPDRTTLTLDVVPAFQVEYVTLYLTNITLSSGTSVSGFTTAQVRNFSARNLADDKPWRVALRPSGSGRFGFVPIGRGLSERVDDVGYLGTPALSTLELNGSLAVSPSSDFSSLSAGLMIRKNGVGRQPYFSILFQPLDDKTSRWLAVQRFSNGQFTSQVLADLTAVGVDDEWGYRAEIQVTGSKCYVHIRTGSASRTFPALEIGEAAEYEEVGLIACRSSDGNNGWVDMHFQPLFVEYNTPPKMMVELNGSDSFRLVWTNGSRAYLPARFEQLLPYPVLRVIEGVTANPQHASTAELPIVDSTGLYTLLSLKH